MRECEDYASFLRIELMALSLGKLPVPMMTVTEDVETYLDYPEELRLFCQVPPICKKQLRALYKSAFQLVLQSRQVRGDNQKLLQKIVESEIMKFYEQHKETLLNVHQAFEGFGKRLLAFVKDHSQKKAIILTCRVHPGEPQSSHMLNGLLKFLMSPEALPLRQNFIFRIVPMLNVDGVVYGNYRCSHLGCDLNRKWDRANRLLHPAIYYSLQMMKMMRSVVKIQCFADLHGHSKKQGAFFYGCCYRNYEHDGRLNNALLRIVPLMCCQKNEFFDLSNCRFNIEPAKTSTARVVAFSQLNVMLSFTLEASFFGIKKGKEGMVHMSAEDYEGCGLTLINTFFHYLPTRQQRLIHLVHKVLRVFFQDFPEHMRFREGEKIRLLEEQEKAKEKKL